MPSDLGLLTNSRKADARACQRLHRYKYQLGYRSIIEVATLHFGTLIHRGLEAWWRAWSLAGQARLDAALAALAGESDPFDLVRAQELIRGYHHRWEAEPYEVLGVELQFEAPLINPSTGAPSRTWKQAGKLDVLVRDLRDGRIRIVEHKTSSEDIRPGSPYYLRLRLDGQVSTYYSGAVALGHDVAGCVYDVLGKPGIRPLKATPEESRKFKKDGTLYAAQRLNDETPEEFRARLIEDIAADPAGYYQRAEVVRLEAEMIEAQHDDWQIGRQIRESELAGRAPRNPDACVRYGRTCAFFGVCCGQERLEDTTKFVQSEVLHPELAAPPDEKTNPEEMTQ